MEIVKKGYIEVPTQPKETPLNPSGIVFKSYDKNVALQFCVYDQKGKPKDLLGATVRLLMYIYDEVDGVINKEPVPFIDANIITDSFLQGTVKYILPEAVKAYSGTVETHVYIDYPDGAASDNVAFTFRMEQSIIDHLIKEKGEYFIQDFEGLLAEASLQTGEVIEKYNAQIDALGVRIDGANKDAQALEERLTELEQGAVLNVMYASSLDFADESTVTSKTDTTLRYKGLCMFASDDPNEYQWELSLQGEEEDLNAAKAYTDEQARAVTTAANSYTDTAKTEAVNSANKYADARKTEAVNEAGTQAQSKVTALENKLTAISHLELNITNGNTGSCHLYRQGKIVTLYFQNLCGKNSGGVNSKIANLPEGSFPPVTFEQLVGSTDRSTLNSAAIEITSSGTIWWKRNTAFGSGYTFVVTYVLG
ncbi:BppU family phage baseplate upper protein [Enterococcus faecium]|nr:BppU family phage baseplate upper protein [Enterococcus faecium]